MKTIMAIILLSLIAFNESEIIIPETRANFNNITEDIELVQKKLKKVTSENFEEEVLKSKKIVILDFSATWCGPCQKLEPVLEQMSEEYKDIKIIKVDVDDQKAKKLLEDYEIKSYPTMVVIKNGEEVGRMKGYKKEEEILKYIEDK